MNARSLKRLEQAHPELRRLLRAAALDAPVAFEVGETLRSAARQRELKAAGASQTLNSRHLAHPRDGLAYAVDVVCYVDGRVRWDWPLYTRLGQHIKAVAARLGIAIVWGGDWRSLRDGPHFELARKVYP